MTEFNLAHVLRVYADVLEEKAANDRAIKAGFHMSNFLRGPSYTELDKIAPDQDIFVLEAGMSPTLCGTQLCVAGFATMEAGWKFKFEKRGSEQQWGYTKTSYITPKGEIQQAQPEWEFEAAKYMGISAYSGQVLFYATFDEGETAIEILAEMVRLGRDLTPSEIDDINQAGRERAGVSDDPDDDPYEYDEYCDCGCMDD